MNTAAAESRPSLSGTRALLFGRAPGPEGMSDISSQQEARPAAASASRMGPGSPGPSARPAGYGRGMAVPLDELGEDPGALFRELVEWSTRPSFGSHSAGARA